MNTNIYKQLLQTVDIRGAIMTLLQSQEQVVVSNRYLPEVLALVANGRATIIESSAQQTILGRVAEAG